MYDHWKLSLAGIGTLGQSFTFGIEFDRLCLFQLSFPPTTQIEASEWEFGLTPLQDHPELVDISGDASSLPQCTPSFPWNSSFFSTR